MTATTEQKKLYENAKLLLVAGDWQESIRALKKSLHIGYHEKSLSYLLYCYLQLNDFPSISRLLKKHKQAGGFALYTRYWFHFLRGDLTELDTLREAMLQSDHYFLRCFALKTSRRILDKAAAVKKYIHFSGLSYDLKLEEYRASVFLDQFQGHYHLAITQIRMGLKDYPDNVELLMDFVELISDMKNESLTWEVLTDPVVQALTEKDYRLMWLSARAYYKIGHYEKAEAFLLKLSRQFPANPLFYYHLANIQASRGKIVNAIRLYREAISLAPLFERAYFNLGTVYIKSGYLNDALPCFEKALRIKRTPQTLHNLTYCLIESKRLEEAYVYLKALPFVPGGFRNELNTIKQKIRDAAVFM